jgi:hypothetical protein
VHIVHLGVQIRGVPSLVGKGFVKARAKDATSGAIPTAHVLFPRAAANDAHDVPCPFEAAKRAGV